MRILLIIDSLNSGGAQRQIVGLAKLLKDKNYDVKVISYHDYPFYKPFLDENGVENEVVPGAYKFHKRIFLIGKVIREYNPDVVISYLDVPNMIACILKLTHVIKCKLIVSERNTTQLLSWKERIKFFLYKWADVIVPNSHSQNTFIAKNYPKLIGKTHVIENFVDTDYFSPTHHNFNSTKKIICVGRISEQKNVKRFIEAISLLKKERTDFHIYWNGKKMGKYSEECIELAKQMNVLDILDFCGADNNIRDRYRECDIFCLPSLYEGFPNVLCEAMSCGLPVLCSNVCDNPKIVENGESGILFEPANVYSISGAIRSMLEMTNEQLARMGEHNRNYAILNFSSKVFADLYIHLF